MIKIRKVLCLAFLCGTVTLLNSTDISAAEETKTKRSGTAMAGISVALEDYYNSVNEGTVSRSVMESLVTTVGLTKAESGYISILDVYDHLGVASLEGGYLNVRKEPKNDGEIIGKLNKNGACEILDKADGWYKIRSGGVVGYASADYIVDGQEAERIAADKASLVVKVETDALRVRTEPSVESRIWDQGYKGETYEVVSDLGDGWVEIHLEGDDSESDGSNGYVYTPGNAVIMYSLPVAVKFSPSEMAAQAQSARRRNAVDYAMQFLGKPYVWGGTNPNTGADCSGFVQYVIRNSAGVSLNRTSSAQSQQGIKVNSSQMKPGDLVFYGSSSGRVNHVAMYIGNGQVIHASSAKTGIKISQWNYRNPVGIRNVIGD